MSRRKFNEAECKYQRTKQWKFIYYMYQQSSSYDDYKKVAQYIIDSGMYKIRMPAGIPNYEKRNWLDRSKVSLLSSVLSSLRKCSKTEQQLIDLCRLTIKDQFWSGYADLYDIDKPASQDISDLQDCVESFDGYYLLYLYDYYDSDRTNSYILKLITLGKSGEQRERLTDASLIVAEKVNRLKNMD